MNDVRIASPCRASWADMAGDEKVRSCGQCKLNVYNLSEMTRAEAETLIQRTEGRLCVRLYRRIDGTVLTKDCPEGARPAFILRVTALTAALLALISATLFGAKKETKPEPVRVPSKTVVVPKKPAKPVVEMGEMVAPPRDPR